MNRSKTFAAAGALVLGALAAARLAAPGDPPRPPAPAPAAASAGAAAFVEVARVLQSPRCQNCHPEGDAPLQGDQGRPHAMNITRASAELGLPCGSCHQRRNADDIGVAGGPPGAPGWALPPRETPMVFRGRDVRALCEQLKDPARNGHRDLAALVEHVSHDPLILWAWQPGGKRTVPPLTHAAFVENFRAWAASGGACP